MKFRLTFFLYYIFRLSNYINLNRNEQLCGIGTCVTPTVLIEFSENAVFNDLLSNSKTIFKCFTLEKINKYFIERNAEASKSKGRSLGMNMMLERISVHQSEPETFIKFACHAEMRKNVQYNGKIHFNNTFGINCSNCSCPAGNAACKHVAAALYVMEYYYQSGILFRKYILSLSVFIRHFQYRYGLSLERTSPHQQTSNVASSYRQFISRSSRITCVGRVYAIQEM